MARLEKNTLTLVNLTEDDLNTIVNCLIGSAESDERRANLLEHPGLKEQFEIQAKEKRKLAADIEFKT